MTGDPYLELVLQREEETVPSVRSQVLFRQLNDQIRVLADGFGLSSECELVCECVDRACFERVNVPFKDYEMARRFPTRFVVKAGHVAEDAERVIQELDGFVIIEKVGDDADIAAALDPRKRRGPA